MSTDQRTAHGVSAPASAGSARRLRRGAHGLALGALLAVALTGCANSPERSGSSDATSRADTAAPRRAAPPAPVDAAELRRLYAGLPERRAPGLPGHVATRAWLDEQLAALGLAGRWLPVEPRDWDGPPLRNLELRLGADPSKPLLLLSCHYDSVPQSPGADDNGSGVVGLLALARRLAPRDLPVELGLLFFDAEELGLIGSWQYCETLADAERERLLGVINLETLAYRDRRPGSQQLPPGFELLLDPGDVGDFLALIGNLDSSEFAETVALGLQSVPPDQLRTVAYSGVPGNGWVVPDTRRSDHAPFWDLGVPAVMLTDTANFRNPNYHRPSDRVETLDLEFLASALRGVERAVLLLAEEAADAAR